MIAMWSLFRSLSGVRTRRSPATGTDCGALILGLIWDFVGGWSTLVRPAWVADGRVSQLSLVCGRPCCCSEVTLATNVRQRREGWSYAPTPADLLPALARVTAVMLATMIGPTSRCPHPRWLNRAPEKQRGRQHD